MGLRINTNVAAMIAIRHLGQATQAVNRSFERLATGRRFTHAGEDPAAAAMAERMEAQLRSMGAAARNAQDGISLLQIGEGMLAEIGTALERGRELAVQAANGTLSAVDRQSLQAEFAGLLQTVDQVANSEGFNGIPLLRDAIRRVRLQIGPDVVQGIDTYDVNLHAATVEALGLGGANIGTAGGATAAITALDGAIDNVARQRGAVGAQQNAILASIDNLDVARENLEAAHSRLVDVDIARETANLVRAQILQQTSLAVLTQAIHQPEVALQLLNAAIRR